MGVLSRTSRKPEPQLYYPNHIYGYGEIDAYRGLLDILGADRIEGISLFHPSSLRILPIAGGLCILTYCVPSAPLTVRVYTLSGSSIHTERLMTNGSETVVRLPQMSSGIYAVQTDCADGRFHGSCLVRL